MATTCISQTGTAGFQDTSASSFASVILAAKPNTKDMSYAGNRSSVSSQTQSVSSNCSGCTSRHQCQSLQGWDPASSTHDGVSHCGLGDSRVSTRVPDAILSSLPQQHWVACSGERVSWSYERLYRKAKQVSGQDQGLTICAICQEESL